jgi:2-dehydropantoate 2-reductase
MKVAVFGAGAVGCYFGGMLARAGVPVTLIAREHHVAAIERDGLFLEGVRIQEHIKVRATTNVSAAHDADVVLFSVKTVDTERAATLLGPQLRRNAVLLSLQNGIDNVERIRSAAGIAAVPSVVYVGAAMAGPGHVRHSGAGNLILGNGRAEIKAIASMFERAEVPCRVSDRIEVELWTKFILNLAYNAISALTQASYGQMGEDPLTRPLMESATKEALAVAKALGVDLDETETLKKVFALASMMPGATSSTAQDVARGSRTEIDSLNGYLARRGAELNVPVPVNQTLFALVKLLETKKR